jgi:hypothetical protein
MKEKRLKKHTVIIDGEIHKNLYCGKCDGERFKIVWGEPIFYFICMKCGKVHKNRFLSQTSSKERMVF